MTINKLVKLDTSHPDPVNASNDWLNHIQSEIICPECKQFDRRKYPKPCDVYLAEDPGHRIEGLTDAGIRIVHVDFMNQIIEHLENYVIGSCFNEDKEKIEEYVTWYTKDIIVQRGNQNTKYYICNTCGRIGYEWWHGRQYVLRCYLSDNLAYLDAYNNLFVAEELFNQLDCSAWRDASWERIKVRDMPMDGRRLPIDPPDAPW